MVPRQIRETLRPVEPRLTYSIAPPEIDYATGPAPTAWSRVFVVLCGHSYLLLVLNNNPGARKDMAVRSMRSTAVRIRNCVDGCYPFSVTRCPKPTKSPSSPFTSPSTMSITALLLSQSEAGHYDEALRKTDHACHERTRGDYSAPRHSDNYDTFPGVRNRGVRNNLDNAGMRYNDQLHGWIRFQPRNGWLGRKWFRRKRRTSRGSNHPASRHCPGTHRLYESQYGRGKRGLGCGNLSRLHL